MSEVNKSRSKDLLNFDEIQEMSSNFEHLKFPKPKAYDFGAANGNATDFYFSLTAKDLENASANVCARVRWLFRKSDIIARTCGRTYQKSFIELES